MARSLRLDHGAIGNGQVLALVAPDTQIEWLCMPRFDSPSVFGALLDRDIGGTFGFESAGDGAESRMAYVPNTNVLRTEVETSGGRYELFDFAPRIPVGLGVEAPVELHRLLRPLTGSPRVRVRFLPRPGYARGLPEIVPAGRHLEITGDAGRFCLSTNLPATYVLDGSAVTIDRPCYFVFRYGRPADIDSAAPVMRALELTIDGWRAWAQSCALPPFAPAEVLRSALCLKLHTFTDTGAIIAAATTSIPEAADTPRTWDYRYCWLRDAAFVVEALRRLSHLSEGEAFVRFLRNVAEEGPLQPVFGIGGERDLPEEHLDHLAGFAGGRPVRIGNAACRQTQHDLMGEMVLCLETILTDPRVIDDAMDTSLVLVERLAEKAIRLYGAEDTGLWEFRTRLRHHAFSKVLCWVAAKRGAELARFHGRADLAERWEQWASARHDEILDRSYNSKLGFFTQIWDGEYPDASLLLLPTFGIVEAQDPRFVSTIREYERRLVHGGLMFRYNNADDFGAPTSAFLICSFWWAEALAMMGELDRAIEVFNRVVQRANPVGLFSEDVDTETGMLLGNFPQAYTHVGLIHAAITIGELLEARDAKFRAWT